MRRLLSEEILLSGLVLLSAGLPPNLFVAAQAGYAKLFVLAPLLLIPSVILLIVTMIVASARGHRRLLNRALAGIGAGIIGTLALEAVRMTSFRLGGMPGDLPRLLGVLMTDRFMMGPSTLSDVLGYAYHYWNGACFGVIFAVLLGRKPLIWGGLYGLFIGIGFLASPAVKAMGVGWMASEMPSMQATVVIAHVAYGVTLAALTRRWIHSEDRVDASNGDSDRDLIGPGTRRRASSIVAPPVRSCGPLSRT